MGVIPAVPSGFVGVRQEHVWAALQFWTRELFIQKTANRVSGDLYATKWVIGINTKNTRLSPTPWVN